MNTSLPHTFQALGIQLLRCALVCCLLVGCVEAETNPPLNNDASGLITALEARIADKTYKDINGIVVLKDGELVLERYFNGSSMTSLHNPRSVGKTFASAMVGIAIRDGYLTGVDQTLGEFYDLKKYKNFDQSKASVTIQQLLTMTPRFR